MFGSLAIAGFNVCSQLGAYFIYDKSSIFVLFTQMTFVSNFALIWWD